MQDAGPSDTPKGASPGLGERQSFPCMSSPSFFSFVKHFCAREWVCSGVSKGASGVLLASMGGMPGWATHQKARRQALANANVPLCMSFLSFFHFLRIFVEGNGWCSGACIVPCVMLGGATHQTATLNTP